MPTHRPGKQIPAYARLAFRGQLFDVYQWYEELPDGTTKSMERLSRPDTVYVVPVTPDGNVSLVEQRREDRRLVGFIGGRLIAGENPEDGARRVLLDEAGLEAGEFVLCDAFQGSSAIDWAIFVYLVRNSRQVIDPTSDSGIGLGVISLNLDELVSAVATDDFVDLEVALRMSQEVQEH